jgi:hypothetical protein
MQLLFGTDEDTCFGSTKGIVWITSVFAVEGPSCMSPTTGSGGSGTWTLFTSEFKWAARMRSKRTALPHFPGFHLFLQDKLPVLHMTVGID